MDYFIKVTKLPRKARYIRYIFKISNLFKKDFIFDNGYYRIQDNFKFKGINLDYIISFSEESLNEFIKSRGIKTFKLLYLHGKEFGIRIIVDVPSQIEYLRNPKIAPKRITENRKSDDNNWDYEISISITRSYFSKILLHYDPGKPRKKEKLKALNRDISLNSVFVASDGIKPHSLDKIVNYKAIQGGKCSPK